MVALGLLLLAGAGLTVLVGFFANNGADHAISGGFELFGYDFNSSTGRLFLFGAIVGVVGMLGLNLLLAGLGRGVKHKVATRRERKTYRRRTETLQEERDRLADELAEQRAREADYGTDAVKQGDTGVAPPLTVPSEQPGNRSN